MFNYCRGHNLSNIETGMLSASLIAGALFDIFVAVQYFKNGVIPTESAVSTITVASGVFFTLAPALYLAGRACRPQDDAAEVRAALLAP